MTATSWCKTPSGARSLLASLIAILLTLPAVAQTQTPIYPLPVITSTPSEPGMVTGDFNGDGLPDTAYVSHVSTPTVTVLLNQGQGNPPTPIAAGGLSCTPQVQLQAGDINKDGKLDLVLTCTEGYVVVLLGKGDGTFQTPAYYSVANVNAIATLVDLNGDGYLDVVVSTTPPQITYGTSTVAVLLNRGGGSPGALASPVIYTAPTNVAFSSVSIGDFNGDGKNDILADGTLSANSQAAIFYGNGDGTLQSAQQITNLAPDETGAGYTVGDFNRDGVADIAYIDTSSPLNQGTATSTLQVLLGSSSGKFTAGSSVVLGAPMSYQFIVPFQPTATSKVTDLALIGSSTTIALGDGSGNFTAGQTYALGYESVSYGNSPFNIFPVVPQTGTNGNTNLIFGRSTGANIFVAGNGDGSFQAVPASLLGPGIGPVVTADLNGDGITDVLSTNSTTGNLFVALGRGNGQFTVTSQSSTTSPFAGPPQIVVPGDFNGDGNVDVVTIFPGNFNLHGVPLTPPPSASVYSGNGDGTFQLVSSAIVLPPLSSPTTAAVAGDFNGDKNLDLIVFYGGSNEDFIYPSGALFFAGHGDNTFAAPVSVQLPLTFGPILVADLNKDGKPDLIYGVTIALGNGDGTFTQQPLGLPGVTTLADLNGDGNLDAVYGASVYAGNGDGTFQTTPFYTNPAALIAVGDVNGDGHLDLLANDAIGANPYLAIYFGDGSGHFTADPNQYPNVVGQLTRLNNQAPLGANDHTLDLLVAGNGVLFSYFNQLNPAPLAPAPLPSKTALAASADSTAPGQQLTLTATVTGATPTGTVSFISNGKALGTAPLINGTATLPTSFAAASTYPVTANYSGDSNNTPSSSNPVSIVVAPISSTTTLSVSAASAGTNQQLTLTASVSGLNPTGTVTFASATATLGTAPVTNGVAVLPFTFTAAGIYTVTASYAGDIANLSSVSARVTVTIAAPDYTVTASPSSATIKAGQSATTTLTVTPVGGYTGTVKFSCGTLPTGVTCNFAPSSITPSTGSATSTLTITTTAPTTAFLRNLSGPLQGIAWASLLFLTLTPRRIFRLNRRLARASLLTLLLAAGLLSFSGCSSSSPSNPPTNPGTPVGVQTITLTTTDSSGNLSHAINFQVTVQ